MLRTRFAVTALLGAALAAVAGGQDRAFTLSFKAPDGKLVPFYQEMSTEVTQHIKVQGQDLPQQQKSTFWYQWTPIKEEKATEGKEEYTRWTLKQKIEGLRMNIDISGNPINYDSTKADAAGAAGNPGLIEFFKNLKDSEFTVTLGKNYKVEKVEGKEAFINKLGSGSAQMDSLLKKVMTDDALKEMTDPTYKLLPDAPKKKGDKWEKKTNLNLGPIGSYELTYKFTYLEPDKEGAKKDFDKIEVETVINYTAPKDTTEGLLFRIKEGSKLTSDPAGSKGVVYYDPRNHRIDEATINIKLKGDLVVVIGGTDTKVELTQEQKTTIKTSDTSFIAPKAPTPPPPPPGK
ncbi:MAG: hypothetical protein J0I06_25145 [Planctomycetes bacterium]|nr:hypothetical protein [Planctomycetota bacterium]